MPPFSMHSDEPTLFDQLHRGALVKEVGDAIAHCEPPQVLGIHGDWGLGKTSLLHQVQHHVTGRCAQYDEAVSEQAGARNEWEAGAYKDTVVGVWFEAWRYQNEPAPIVALLHEIRAQLSVWTKALREGSKLVQVTIRGALLSLESLTAKIGFQASKIEKAGKEWEAEHFASALPANTIRDQLEQAIRQLLSEGETGKPARRLAVLIDDLDRCESDAAYRLLTELKLYLTLPNCVFVIAMNQKVIEDAIARHIPGPSKDSAHAGEERRVRAAAYLQKLCQNIWHLPAVAEPNRVLGEWLDDAALRQRLACVLEAKEPCVPPNPRRIKALANLLRRWAGRLDPNPELAPDIRDKQARMLFLVAYVYQFHPDLFRRWEHRPEVYQELVARCHGRETPIEPLRALNHPGRYEADSSKPDAAYVYKGTAFPDPSDPQVFWAQAVVHALHQAQAVPNDFAPYLRG